MSSTTVSFHRLSRAGLRAVCVISSAAFLATTLTDPAFAANAAAKASGNWENTAVWTTGAVPNAADNVYIGATDPAGAILNASVTLTADESASIVFVGYGSPTNGTLNLGGKKLTLGSLYIGYAGGSPGHLVEAGGSFSAGGLNMFGAVNSLTLGPADTVSGIDIETGATLTTAAAGNFTGGGSIVNGGVLNLGANTTLTGGLNVQGTGSTLNLAGNNLMADSLSLGYFATSAVNFQRGSGTPGTLNLNTLNLGHGQNVTMVAGDTLTGGGILGVGGSGAVTLEGGSTLTTVDSLNVTCTVNVVASTLNLGADMNIGNQTINAANGAMLNLAGHNLAASYLLLGYAGTSTATLNRGSGTPGNLTLGNLFLGNSQNLTLIAGDTINSGSDGVNVTAGATLTLGANDNISDNAVNIKTGGTFNIVTFSDTVGAVKLESGTITGTTGVLTGASYEMQSGAVDATLGGAGDALTKTTGGTVTLSRDNTYGGGTTVSGGTLLANNATGSATGSGGIIINSGGTFGGTGAVEGGVSVLAGGALAPGASIESLSTGSVTLAAAATLAVELDLDVPAADLLDVTGTIDVTGATLALSITDAPLTLAAPLTFLIAQNDGDGMTGDAIAGTFATIMGISSSYAVALDYAFVGVDALGRVGNGNDLAVMITAVPEAGAWLLVGVVTIGAIVVQRFRRAN